MKNYRKEWEEKKPVCPECGTTLVGSPNGTPRCPSCGLYQFSFEPIHPYTQYLESELEKRDKEITDALSFINITREAYAGERVYALSIINAKRYDSFIKAIKAQGKPPEDLEI